MTDVNMICQDFIEIDRTKGSEKAIPMNNTNIRLNPNFGVGYSIQFCPLISLRHVKTVKSKLNNKIIGPLNTDSGSCSLSHVFASILSFLTIVTP